jgi:4-hydroxyphenylacetate 3-monooxygenase
MLRTGEQYREPTRDGRQIWINGERVKDVTTHPAFKPIVDPRARLYDMAHEAKFREVMTCIDEASNEPCNRALKLRRRKPTGTTSAATSRPAARLL